MKIHNLLEGDVTDITQARNSDRRYGADGYQSILSTISANGTADIPVVQEKPLIKASKQLSRVTLTKAVTAAGFVSNGNVSFAVANLLNNNTPTIDITIYVHSNGEPVDARIAVRARLVTIARCTQAIARLFGTFAKSIKLTPFGTVIVSLDQSYLQGAGHTRKPVVTEEIKAILRKLNIGGLNFLYVTRTKGGYSVKIEGAELVDERSLRLLEMAFRQKFGELFISMKNDGIIDNIGYRPAPDGVTNYRLYFKHELATQYQLQS